jgi:outer membrane beta-barrel protein
MFMRNFARILLLSMVCLSVWPLSASAQDYSAMVVQNRRFDPTHEFSFAAGWLPLDAFTKGVSLTAAYTLHFNESWAWEIGNFTYSLQYDTDLFAQLEAIDTRPGPFEVIDFFATSSVVWKPLYWKGSWLNSSLTYGEFFLVLGGGYGWLTRSARPALDAGGGFRIYGNSLLSFRLDIRYLMFFGDEILERFDVKDELWIGLGTSLSF